MPDEPPSESCWSQLPARSFARQNGRGRAQPGQQVRQQLADKMQVVLDDQRLVRSIHCFGDGRLVAGGQTTAQALMPLAADLRDFEMPRPIAAARGPDRGQATQ